MNYLVSLSNQKQNFYNQYNMGPKVSSGSVGVIYEAIHRDTLQVYALKQVRLPEKFTSNGEVSISGITHH